MKKNIFIMALAIVFVFPFLTNAQTLSREDVKSVAPQLINALSGLSNAIGQKQNQFNAQNNALISVIGTMGAVVNIAGDLDRQNLTSQDRSALNNSVDSLSGLLGSMNTYVSKVVDDRNNFNNALDSVVSILGSITQTISTAV